MGTESLLNSPFAFRVRQYTTSLRDSARAFRSFARRRDKENHNETLALEKPLVVADAAIIGLTVFSLMRF